MFEFKLFFFFIILKQFQLKLLLFEFFLFQ